MKIEWQALLEEPMQTDGSTEGSCVGFSPIPDVSVVLFGTNASGEDGSMGDVVAARMPERLRTQRNAWETAWEIEPAVLASSWAQVSEQCPVMVAGEQGVGWLMSGYRAVAGLGLYVHVHCSSQAAVRVARAGAFGTAFGVKTPDLAKPSRLRASDEQVYRQLAERWHRLDRWNRGLLRGQGETSKRVNMVDVVSMVDELAAWAGCRAVCTERATGSALCYLPRLLEATVLFFLCHARHLSPLRCLTYRVTSSPDVCGDRLVWHMEMPCLWQTDGEGISPETLIPGLDYIRWVTEQNDGICLCTWGDVYLFDSTVTPKLRCRDLMVTVTYPRDPLREPWSDFKYPRDRHT